jgi:hypothetical protein
LTHKQWIFRNADVHHKIDGLTSAQHDALSEKIRTLIKTSPANLLPCHCHLLDRNFHDHGNGETIHQQLWEQCRCLLQKVTRFSVPQIK